MSINQPFDQNRQVSSTTPDTGMEKKKGKILLADDDIDRINETVVLLTLMDYEVVVVRNGRELLNKIKSGEKFTAVLTDNNMPEMNGIEVLEEIRKNPEFDKLSVILRTGLPSDELIARVEACKNSFYLQKPHGLDALENFLEKAIEISKS